MTELAKLNLIGCKEDWEDEVFLWSPTSKKKKCQVEDIMTTGITLQDGT